PSGASALPALLTTLLVSSVPPPALGRERVSGGDLRERLVATFLRPPQPRQIAHERTRTPCGPGPGRLARNSPNPIRAKLDDDILSMSRRLNPMGSSLVQVSLRIV